MLRTPAALLLLALQGAPDRVSAGSIAPVECRVPSAQASHGGMLIDGSGLAEEPPGSGIFVHSAGRWADGGSMWVSGGDEAGTLGKLDLRFDLGRGHDVRALHVWNYNEQGYTGRSVKSFDLEVSVDGSTWTPAGSYGLRQASGRDDEAGERIPLAAPVKARHLRIKPTANYGEPRWTGLSEIRVHVADPAPDSRVLRPRPPFKPRYPRTSYAPRAPGAGGIAFPEDARVVDLTKPPYEVKGDGATDATAAIQRAFMDHVNAGAILYLPDGVYKVSDTIRWGHRRGRDGKIEEGSREKNTVLHGQSRDGTVLLLADGAPGFDAPRKPKAVLWTGSDPAQRFANEIAHLTVDSGARNPGCAAVQFVANNQGSLHHVKVVSGDGQGVAGIDLASAGENGPLLVRHAEVVGFDVGVKAAGPINSQTLEHVVLRHQNLCGLENIGEHLSVRGLRSENAVPALRLKGGLLSLLDADLRGADAKVLAIEGGGGLYMRDVRSSGYAGVLQPGVHAVDEHASKSAPKAPRLPVQETPDLPPDPFAEWVSPTHFGAKPDDPEDDTAAIQKAIDAGKRTVYFPRGTYRVRDTIEIRGKVRRLVGCRANLDVPDMDRPAFRLSDGEAPVVEVDRFSGGYARTTTFEHASKRTLVLRRCLNVNAHVTAGGDFFIEDTVSNPQQGWVFKGGRIWGRQFNVENEGTHVTNDGGSLWILGYKTERGGTLIETRGRGVTELLGGFSYTTTRGGASPMFTVDGARLFAVFGEVCFNNDPYRIIVREAGRTDVTRDDPRYGSALFYGTR